MNSVSIQRKYLKAAIKKQKKTHQSCDKPETIIFLEKIMITRVKQGIKINFEF